MLRQKRTLFLIVLAAMLVLAGCQASANQPEASPGAYGPAPLPQVAQPASTATPATLTLATVADVPRITPKEVRDLQMVGRSVVIADSRDLQYYNQGHIRGAISMPEDEIEIRYRDLPQDAKIVFYCT